MKKKNTDKQKLNLAIYWGSACGGCCVSVLDVHEQLFTVTEHANLVFWPIALDTKYKDVKNFEDGFIDVTLFNGAVRNSENEEMAHLIRKKSKILVAYGSCSHLGGIPGLANFHLKDEILKRVYFDCESNDNKIKHQPKEKVKVTEGELHLPEFYNDVRSLDQVIDVDFYLPGCPPQTERLVEVFLAIVNNDELPPKGSVVGASENTQCEECERKKTDNKHIKRFYRPSEIKDDGETCFLEQGIICMGPATRRGCGFRCIEGNSPCRGCYGPTAESPDPGAKMMSAIATMIDENDPNKIQEIVDQIHDPAGTFYRYSLPASMLRRKLMNTEKT